MEKLKIDIYDLLRDLGIQVEFDKKFDWLTNRVEQSEIDLWRIFVDLGGSEKGMRSKGLRELNISGYLPKYERIIEFDNLRHFTEYRLKTLEHYPSNIRLGFNMNEYQESCKKHGEEAFWDGSHYGNRNETGEFPFFGGRAAQRALFDACQDLLPSKNNLNPTIRISKFQVPSIWQDKDKAMEELQSAIDTYL